MSSNRNCSVAWCTNTYAKASKQQRLLQFYSFPSYLWLKERRAKWIAFASRTTKDGTPWQPTRSSKVCSEHFVTGEKSEDPRKVNYNPTLRGPRKNTSATSSNNDSSELSILSSQSDDNEYDDDGVSDSQTTDENVLKAFICIFCSSECETKTTQNLGLNRHWIKFCSQVFKSEPEMQEFLKTFEYLGNLTICSSCSTLVKSSVMKDKAICEVNRKVSVLQQQLMKVLLELQARVEDFYEDMCKIGNIINAKNIMNALKKSKGCTNDNSSSSLAILYFRNRVLFNVEKLQTCGKKLERKTNCEMGSNQSKFVDLDPIAVNDDISDMEIEENIENEFSNISSVVLDQIDEDIAKDHTEGSSTAPLAQMKKDFKEKEITEHDSKGAGASEVSGERKGEKKFFCDLCGRGFIAEFTLNCHQWAHMSNEEQAESIRNGVSDPWTEKYKHKRKGRPAQPHPCSTCGKIFFDPYAVKEHEKIHDKTRERIMCAACGRQILAKGFKFHQKSCESRQEEVGSTTVLPFECDICGKRYRTKIVLRMHIQKHSSEKPFLCSMCPKAFTVMDLLRKHQKSHCDDRPFVCGKGCGGGFKNKKNRKNHEKICNGRGTPLRKKAKQVAPPTYSEQTTI